MAADDFGIEAVHNCALCSAQGEALYAGLADRFFSAPGVWGYRICRACRLIWLDPRPATDSLPLMYRGYYTHTSADSSGWPSRLTEAVIARACGWPSPRAGLAESVLSWLVERLGLFRDIVGCCDLRLSGMKPGRVLEIGCGNGRHLMALKNLGWTVAGVEPDRDAALQARDGGGLDVFAGTLEQASFPDSRFDAVIIRNAFGYITTPMATLAEIMRVLRAGGRLVMVVPNSDSLGHRLFGSAWLMLDPPREHFIFNQGSLRAIAEKAGFVVRSIDCTSRHALWTWIFSRAIRRHGRVADYILSPGALISPLAPLFQVLETAPFPWHKNGEELFLVAEKPQE